jgi:hypothetical protein
MESGKKKRGIVCQMFLLLSVLDRYKSFGGKKYKK